MNQPNYQDYYISRAAASRSLAQRAADPMIAAIHAELADRYDVLVAQTSRRPDDQIMIVQTS